VLYIFVQMVVALMYLCWMLNSWSAVISGDFTPSFSLVRLLCEKTLSSVCGLLTWIYVWCILHFRPVSNII
jgi:hypothetical protein